VVAASAEAAAAREPGFTGESNSGVVNILSLSGGGEPVFEFPPPRGLFVMASRTALCGGVLARCAMIVLVLDLDTVLAPRIFARELAVGANSLDVVPVGLKMDALLRSSTLLLLLLLLLLAPSAAVSTTPGTRPVERKAPLVYSCQWMMRH
jgi:hypothetical protein